MWGGFSSLKTSLTSFVESSGIKEAVQSTVKTVTEKVNEVAQSLSLDALQEENAPRKALYEGLDVTYLTPRVVAMTFPTFPDSRIRSRNDAGAVRALLEERHGEHYMIWNCSEESYDAGFFGGRVIEVKFPGYPAPPLDMLFRLCTSIGNWLAASESNVAVIHCMTGKGRTCTIAACVLAWLGEFSSPLPALAYVCERRSRDLHLLRVRGKHGTAMGSSGVLGGAPPLAASTAGAVASGITTVGNLLLGPQIAGGPHAGGADPFLNMPLDPIAALLCPSQQRYVRYFGLACCDGVKPRAGASATLLLRRVVIHGAVALEKIPTATATAMATATTTPATAAQPAAAAASADGAAASSASSSSSSSSVQQHLKNAREGVKEAANTMLTTLANAAGVDNQGADGSGSGSGNGTLGEDGQPINAFKLKLLPPSQAGYRPSLQIFKGSRLVHNTLWTSGEGGNPGALEGWVSIDEGAARFSLDVPVAGDCLIRCRHISSSSQHDRETIWRASFHAGYILSNQGGSASGAVDGCSLRLSKRQLDLACDDDRVDDSFTVELLFAPVEEDLSAKASGASASEASTATAEGEGAGSSEGDKQQPPAKTVEGAVKLSSVADAESFNKAAAAEDEFWSRISEARTASLSRANEAKGARARALQAKLAAAKEGALTSSSIAAAGSNGVGGAPKPYDDALEVDPEADLDSSSSSSSSADDDFDGGQGQGAGGGGPVVARIERRLKRLDADIEPCVSGRGPSLGWIIKNAPPKAPSSSTASSSSSSAAPAASSSSSSAAAKTTAPSGSTIAMGGASSSGSSGNVSAGPASRRGSGSVIGGGSGVAGAGGAASSSSAAPPSSSAFDKDLADLEELERELGIGSGSGSSTATAGSAPAPAAATTTTAPASSVDAKPAVTAPASSSGEEDDVVDELEKYLNL